MFVLVGLGVGILAGMLLQVLGRSSRSNTLVTVHSLSPNGEFRVNLVEQRRSIGHIDRNFTLQLEYLKAGKVERVERIFVSPDEGLPVGSERFIWAKDSSRFLLVGRHFFVHEHAATPDGELLYLLYDLNTGTIKCNATQQDQCPTFTRQEVAETEWYVGGT